MAVTARPLRWWQAALLTVAAAAVVIGVGYVLFVGTIIWGMATCPRHTVGNGCMEGVVEVVNHDEDIVRVVATVDGGGEVDTHVGVRGGSYLHVGDRGCTSGPLEVRDDRDEVLGTLEPSCAGDRRVWPFDALATW